MPDPGLTEHDKLAVAAALQEQAADALNGVVLGNTSLDADLAEVRQAMIEMADGLKKLYMALTQKGKSSA